MRILRPTEKCSVVINMLTRHCKHNFVEHSTLHTNFKLYLNENFVLSDSESQHNVITVHQNIISVTWEQVLMVHVGMIQV